MINGPTGETRSIQLRSSELVILLAQGYPIKASLPDDWRSIIYAASDDSSKALVVS